MEKPSMELGFLVLSESLVEKSKAFFITLYEKIEFEGILQDSVVIISKRQNPTFTDNENISLGFTEKYLIENSKKTPIFVELKNTKLPGENTNGK